MSNEAALSAHPGTRTPPGALRTRTNRVLARRTAAEWRWLAVACGIAVLAGGAAARSNGMAVLPFVLAGAVVACVVPIHWLGIAAVVAGLTFRLAVPTAAGPAAYVPDALILLTCLRAGAQVAIGRGRRMPPGLALACLALVAFASLALASTLVNRQAPIALIGSLRQFVRYPALAIALAAAGVTWREARKLLVAVLAVSLVELPLTIFQYRHPVSSSVIPGVRFFSGDNVSGTFGFGGNSEDMVFLVICTGLWLALATQRRVRAWTLLALAPILVVPMGLGSSASFVLFLPLAIIGIVAWAAVRRQTRMSLGMVLVGGAFLGVLAWSAGALALAPGFGAETQTSASTVLSSDYLSSYVTSTARSADPSTRLGFLRFAAQTDLRSGGRGILLGQGPVVSFLGPRSGSVTNAYLVDYPVLQVRSVQSLQRALFGYGFAAVALFAFALLAPALAVLRARPPTSGRRAIVLAMPVLAIVVLLAGVYNAAWTDPGVAAAYWTVALAAGLAADRTTDGASERAAERADEPAQTAPVRRSSREGPT